MAECKDCRCPVHGSISVRGNVFTGIVVSARPSKTVVVQRTIVRHVKKYERYKKSKSKIYAHNPGCINAKQDDVVKVGETRRLSKTKSFVVLAVLGKKKIVKAEDDTFREKEKEEEHKGKKLKAENEAADGMQGKGGKELRGEKGKPGKDSEEESGDSE